MKICWFGIYDKNYSRNLTLIAGLEELPDVQVIECNSFGRRGFVKYFILIKKLLKLNNSFDVLYCAFPINYNVIIARIFSRKPIVVDAFFPLYDAYVEDRKVLGRYSIKGIVYNLLDRLNLYLADLIVTDTSEHKKYWSNIYKNSKIIVIPVGAYSKQFFPIPRVNNGTEEFSILFYGSYIPLQGVNKIVEAFDLLKENKNYRFKLIGNGQTYSEAVELADKLRVNVEFLPWLGIEELNHHINNADIILGIFGDTKKTERVVPNKLYQAIAARRPVITKETEAVKEFFNSSEVLMVKNEPIEIAHSIKLFYNNRDLMNLFADNGYNKYVKFYTEKQLALDLLSSIKDYLKSVNKSLDIYLE